MSHPYASAVLQGYVGERRSGYLHLQFQGSEIEPGLRRLDEAVRSLGWVPVDDEAIDATALHQRQWRHRRAPVGLLWVAISFHPLAVTIGPHPLPPLSGRHTARATVRELRRRAQRLGATAVPDARLAEVVATAQRRWARAAGIAHEIERLEFVLRYRACPDCAEWGESNARWCWRCEYEFTGEDDHIRDASAVAARQRIDWLRRLSLDGPDAPLPAPPPISPANFGEWR